MVTEIPLSPGHRSKYGGRVALVDDADVAILAGYAWRAVKASFGERYYARGSRWGGVKTVQVAMHRLIMALPPDILVDHRDGDGLNNQRDNLRACRHQGNQANRPIPGDRPAHAPYKGVRFWRKTGRWEARIKINQRTLHLGYFATPEEAAVAYDAAARNAFGEFAVLNLPDDGGYHGRPGERAGDGPVWRRQHAGRAEGRRLRLVTRRYPVSAIFQDSGQTA